MPLWRSCSLLVLGLCLSAGAVRAQTASTPPEVIVPVAYRPPGTPPRIPWSRPGTSIEVRDTLARVEIVDLAATTTLRFELANPTSRRVEAELVIPVPAGAVLRGFNFQGSGKEPSAKLLEREVARELYESIVRRQRDPALLEFIGTHTIRTSVFPLEPRGGQVVEITYEELLRREGNRVDYVLPRSESLAARAPWQIQALVRTSSPVSTIYSPSHEIEVACPGQRVNAVRFAPGARPVPGSFRLSYLLEAGDVTASLVTYPDPSVGGGYFLLLGGLPALVDRERTLTREVTLVLDRSGSMNGEKLEQAREAALQVISGLDDRESFNLIVYNESVDLFASEAVERSEESVGRARKYLESVRARGGTNLHDALLEALSRPVREGVLPIVLFLTDGLPTLGQTSERAIRELAAKHNPHRRRIFTFGVGADVNTALLEAIAFASRGVTTFVSPREDVEVKVADVFRRLQGPVLSEPRLEILAADGQLALHRVRDLLPGRLPDLYHGDQLVVLGKYLRDGKPGEAAEPLTFELRGRFLGEEKRYRFAFELDRASTRNAHVPRLWASRKIGMLEDAIRELGADAPRLTSTLPRATAAVDPMKELVDEIVRLSREFGVLSEYTAFFAEEGTDLSDREVLLATTTGNFARRSIGCRSGIASWNQDLNRQVAKARKVLNFGNEFLNAGLNRVEISTVQQIHDRAFFRRGRRWVDSRLLGGAETARPRRVIPFGSEAHSDLLRRLAGEGRPGCLSLPGEILLEIDGESVLVQSPDGC